MDVVEARPEDWERDPFTPVIENGFLYSPSFIKQSDNFSHGLNERIPLLNVRPGVIYYLSVLRDLAGS